MPSTEGASTPKDQESKFKVEVPDELPFQLQIKYTDTEGATALRVLTQTKPITRDRKQAEGSKIQWVTSLPYYSHIFKYSQENIKHVVKPAGHRLSVHIKMHILSLTFYIY